LTRGAGSLLVAHGRVVAGREIGMDAWGWENYVLARLRRGLLSGRCSASSTVQTAADPGQVPLWRVELRRLAPGQGTAPVSHHTSYAMPTPLSSRREGVP